MGQKTNPIGNRLGIIRGWESNWYGGQNFGNKLAEDAKIRKYLRIRLSKGSVSKIAIERTLKLVTITVHTARPGIIIGKFLAALKQQKIYGIRANDGSVLFPPTEYDPRTAESLDDFVPLSDQGRLLYWTWIDQPRDHHQMSQPFAFAMIQLDGAAVPFLHRMLADSAEDLSSGMAVKVKWAEERRGAITDIYGFVAAMGG